MLLKCAVVCAALVFLLTAASAGADAWVYQSDDRPAFWLPDKLQHFAGSFALSERLGLVPAVALGAAWESWQRLENGLWSWRDFAADIAGAIAARLKTPWSAWCLYDPVDRSLVLILAFKI